MSTQQSTVEYRIIKDFPDYAVGNDGSVWSRRIPKSKKKKPWVQLKPKPTSKWGHLFVTLSGCKYRLVSHLVLEAFVGPRPEGHEACHFPDRNPANNRLENLRWGTSKDNKADQKIHGTSPVGEKNGYSKLTDEMVRGIRADYKFGVYGAIRVGKKYGVSEQTVRRVVRRTSWSHVV